MDTGLDENEAELAVLVLAVALEVLPDGDGLDTCYNLRLEWFFGMKERIDGWLTFLMRWYRSSGISGARPGCHSVSL